MIRIFCISAALAGFVALTANGQAAAQTWTVGETGMLRSLWIGSLGKLPQDPSNAFADDPMAAELGHKIFFDPRFSANAKVSCATCHQPELAFTDGLPLAQGVGAVPGHTPTIIGMAYSPWFFWDGRKDSQWSQALGPMESPVEHGGTAGVAAFALQRQIDFLDQIGHDMRPEWDSGMVSGATNTTSKKIHNDDFRRPRRIRHGLYQIPVKGDFFYLTFSNHMLTFPPLRSRQKQLPAFFWF